MSTKIVIYNGRRAETNIRNLAYAMYDFNDTFEDIGQYFREQVAEQFDLRGFLPGIAQPWRKLSPFTIYSKRSTRPLVYHGDLMDSYVDPFNTGNISEVGRDIARFGSKYKAKNNAGKIKPIAKFHQQGTRYMPERPISLANRFMEDDIVDLFIEHIFDRWV
jgi:hypothetical protein